MEGQRTPARGEQRTRYGQLREDVGRQGWSPALACCFAQLLEAERPDHPLADALRSFAAAKGVQL
jgi:hypothetical protein